MQQICHDKKPNRTARFFIVWARISSAATSENACLFTPKQMLTPYECGGFAATCNKDGIEDYSLPNRLKHRTCSKFTPHSLQYIACMRDERSRSDGCIIFNLISHRILVDFSSTGISCKFLFFIFCVNVFYRMVERRGRLQSPWVLLISK